MGSSKKSPNGKHRDKKRPTKSELETSGSLLALEPRYLFDAAGVATMAETAADAVAHAQADQTVVDTGTPLDEPSGNADAPTGVGLDDNLLNALNAYSPPSVNREIVFVDSAVEDYQTLITGIDPRAEVVILDPNRDGVEQIAAVLSQYQDVQAVHLLAHGDEGVLFLGNSRLTLESMDGQYAEELARIGQSLSEGADVFVYGCNFGQGLIGRAAAAGFAAATGADIAASTDTTGHSSLGGDWQLEYHLGNIEAEVVFDTQTQWLGTLAVDDSAATQEDTQVKVDVVANDGFPPLTNLAVDVNPGDQPDNGTVIRNLDDSLSYTPAPDFNGTDAFVYTVTITHSDFSTSTETATVTLTVTPVTDAIADAVTTSEDTPVTFDALANDLFAGPDNVTLSIASGNEASNGSLVVNPDGTLTYSPDADFTGTDSFVYTATVLHTDGSTNTETATVTVTVTPVADALADPVTTLEDMPVSVDLLSNDLFADPTKVTVTVPPANQPANGTAIVNADKSVTYAPDADFTGTDSFVYTATVLHADGSTNTEMATVTVMVTPVADVVADTVATPEDTPLAIDVLANDQFADPTKVTVTVPLSDQPANGTAIVNPNRTVTYVPDADFTGPDSFVYMATVLHTDGSTNTETATVTVTVTPVADVVADTVSTEEDTPVSIDVLANDLFADPTKVTVTVPLSDQPANGTAIVNPNRTVTYIPDADFTGTDSFIYTATVLHADGSTNSETATVTVAVTPVTDTVADTVTTPEDTQVAIDVLANDLFADPTKVTVTVPLSDQPANGTAIVNPNRTVTYIPDADFTGTDSFIYTATVLHADGSTNSEAATVTVTVTPVTDTVADTVTTPEDTPVAIDVLANDLFADPTKVTVSVALADQPANGTVIVNPNRTLTYVPDADFTGTDSFVYTATELRGDGSTNIETAIVTVTVTPMADTIDDMVTTAEDTLVSIDVLANDLFADPTKVTVSVALADQPANGVVIVNPNRTLTYVPDADFTGTDTFVYTATVSHRDGSTATEIATVAVTVTPVADVVADTASTPEDTPMAIDVLANDLFADPTRVTVSVALADQPANGTVIVNPNRTLTYVPDADFTGTDTIVYTAHGVAL